MSGAHIAVNSHNLPNPPFMEKSGRFGYTAPKRGSGLREDRCVEET